MQARFLAHQNLHAENVLYAGAGTYLEGLESGTVAAGDVVLRLDVAELLVTQALQTDVPTAVAAARRVIGDEAVLRALPVLQRVALSSPTRAALRGTRTCSTTCAPQLLTINPTVEIEPIDLERLKPRTVFTLILGTVALYLLLSQLAQVNVAEVIASADWRWAGVALALSMVTYLGATMALGGFVPDRLSFLRTLQAQFAASFATLVSPPTLGAVAVNARFLNRSGLPPGCGRGDGRGLPGGGVHRARDPDAADRDRRRDAGRPAVQPPARGDHRRRHRRDDHRRAGLDLARAPLVDRPAPADDRAGHPPVGDRGPATRRSSPRGSAGSCCSTWRTACAWWPRCGRSPTRLTVAAISFVYLAGSTLGQAAPTPGGLGVVEAAIAAGLTAAGLNPAVAVSATLLFRLVTFWLPTVPGWFAFRNLTAKGLL